VQGYVYAARLHAAKLATLLGHHERAAELRQQARTLQERFETVFWCEDLGLYALALDGDKQPCRVRSSNAGHCLFSGIARPDRARRVADVLLSDVCFSGWGVRTLAMTEPRYNPMSYHNGSVWPHDNALIAAGLARYGFQEHALTIMTALFDASRQVDLNRLPELYCGFPRQPGHGLTLYPVACSPQAWAAGAIFLLLQASLGLTVDAVQQQLRFSEPLLPEWLETVRIANLRVGPAVIDLALHRRADRVDVQVLRKRGTLEIVFSPREDEPS
jgi:glycogen debranching enzyme